jgi:hypothetical protein
MLIILKWISPSIWESMQHLLKIFRQAFLLLVSFLDQYSKGGSVRQIKRGVQIFSKRASSKYKVNDAILTELL